MGLMRPVGLLAGVALIIAGALIVVPVQLGGGAGGPLLVAGAVVALIGALVLGFAWIGVPGRT